MIVFPCSSQITYTINNSKYICYTPSENRDIAFLIYYGNINKAFVEQFEVEVKTYQDLVLIYKQDSVNCKSVVSQLNSKLVLQGELQAKLHNEIDVKDNKIKNRNKVIGALIGTNLISIILFIIAIR